MRKQTQPETFFSVRRKRDPRTALSQFVYSGYARSTAEEKKLLEQTMEAMKQLFGVRQARSMARRVLGLEKPKKILAGSS